MGDPVAIDVYLHTLSKSILNFKLYKYSFFFYCYVNYLWCNQKVIRIYPSVLYTIVFPGEVMGTDNWKKMKEENPAVLCDLQQMVLTAPTA
jgi:hypothetical protein